MPKILLATGQTLDSLTFALFFLLVPPYLIEAAGKSERNPVIAALLAIGGVTAVVITKQLITLFAIWRLSHNRTTFKIKSLVILASISGFIGATFNTIAILQVVRFL